MKTRQALGELLYDSILGRGGGALGSVEERHGHGDLIGRLITESESTQFQLARSRSHEAIL
jgi:hypothetical protein